MKEIVIDGEKILSEYEFHKYLGKILDFGPYYGDNLDALYDRIYRDVERPICIVWKSSNISKLSMGDAFDKIINVFDAVRRRDKENGCSDEFCYRLE